MTEMRADDKRHGTNAGYAAHRKTGQKACRPCTAAASAYSAVKRARDLADIALTGGAWINDRGIQRWVSGGSNDAA